MAAARTPPRPFPPRPAPPVPGPGRPRGAVAAPGRAAWGGKRRTGPENGTGEREGWELGAGTRCGCGCCRCRRVLGVRPCRSRSAPTARSRPFIGGPGAGGAEQTAPCLHGHGPRPPARAAAPLRPPRARPPPPRLGPPGSGTAAGPWQLPGGSAATRQPPLIPTHCPPPAARCRRQPRQSDRQTDGLTD